jgi:hypothetical protein
VKKKISSATKLLLGRGALNLLCVGEIDERDFETLEQFASTKLTL